MALDFPDAPTNGQVFAGPSANFIWNINPGRWRRAAQPLTLTMLVPNHGLINATHAVELIGTGFTPTTKVLWQATFLPVTFVSSTLLRVTAPSHSVAEAQYVYCTEDEVNWTQPPMPFTYDPIPLVLTSLNPASSIQGTVSGQGPNVILTGSGFNNECYAWINGIMTQTTYQSPTQLTALAVENRTVGTFPVYVKNNPTQAISNSLDFYVTSNQPPVLISVSPNTAQQGSTIATLTVTGQNFVNGKRIKWNGVAVATTYVSATTLTTTNVVCPVSRPYIPVTVEDCPGEVRVTLTALPGAVTIDPVIYPGIWPHSAQGNPYYGNCYCVITSNHDIAGCYVHMNGVPAEKTWTGDAGKQLWFTPGYQGGDPNIMQYFWVTIVKNGVPSANGGNLPVGSP